MKWRGRVPNVKKNYILYIYYIFTHFIRNLKILYNSANFVHKIKRPLKKYMKIIGVVI